MATKKKRALNAQNDRWVAIAADSFDTSETDDSKPVFVRVKNPATDVAALYLFGMGDSHVYEVKAFDEDHHSWFIGQTVLRDGRLLYITPMDPLYLLLPYIVKAGKEGKFQPLEQVVMDEDFPACSRLLRCARTQASLPQIAEEKEFGSQRVYKYSQEKTMEWLKKKVNQTVKALKKSNILVGGGVKSATYIRTKQECNVQEEDYLRYAHGLISEYISQDLSKELQSVLRLPEIVSPTESEPPVKKRKLSDTPVEAGEDYTVFNSASFTRKPPKKMTAAQKSLAKVDKTGMKTMSAFFSPKVKMEKN